MKAIPILLAFLVMGIADAMGPMSEAVKDNFELSAVMATLLSFFVFIAFAVFSVPGGMLAARIGKKKLLLLGLGLNALAMLVPSIIDPGTSLAGFYMLLGCIFVLGIGTTFLQVAGNPIMRDVSPAGKYSRNLSFAQGFKGVGSSVSAYVVSGTVLAGIPIVASMGWRGVFPIFFIFMAVAFVWVATMKIDETKATVPPSIGSSVALLAKPIFFMAVLGIFLYVGAEVCMGRFLLPLLQEVGIGKEEAARYGAPVFFLMITAGRLAGGGIAHFISAHSFFRVSAAMGLVGVLLLMFGGTSLAIPGVVLGGLGFANIWPMLFSITVEEDPERGSELSGLMCMAISGGALVPLVMGKLVDSNMGSKSFIVPLICFIYLLVLSMKGKSKQTEEIEADAVVESKTPGPVAPTAD